MVVVSKHSVQKYVNKVTSLVLTGTFGILSVFLTYYAVKGSKKVSVLMPRGFNQQKLLILITLVIIIFVSRAIFDFINIFGIAQLYIT